MRMPYWLFLLHFALLSVAAHRAIGAYVLFVADAPWVLAACLGVEAVFALFASVAMWLPLPFQLGAISSLASVVVAASIVQMFVLGQRAAPLLIGKAMFALVAASGVVMVLRYADAHPEGNASR